MIGIRKLGLLNRELYLFGRFTIIFSCLLFLVCQGNNIKSYIEKKDIDIPGIYPKIFPCIGKYEKKCIYYTGEDGSIWFFSTENLDKPIATIAYKSSGGLALPIMFSQNLTVVAEAKIDNPKYFLMVNGVTTFSDNVDFASVSTQALLFGDNIQRKVIFFTDQEILIGSIPNDKNILFETDDQNTGVLNREIEVVGGWGKCSSVISHEGLVEGVVFSEIFSALNYFFFSKDKTISEFVGWEEVEETSYPEYTGIPSLYSVKLKRNAYPSANSTKILPSYIFGFLDPNTIIFVSPLSPPAEIKIRYLETSKRYKGDSCSITSDDRGITYIFGSNQKELIMFQKKKEWSWEKVADFSAGELLSFVYRNFPCVVFTNLKDMSLRISCKSNNIWTSKEIDSGFIYGVSLYNDGYNLILIYNMIDERGNLKIRLSTLKLDSLL